MPRSGGSISRGCSRSRKAAGDTLPVLVWLVNAKHTHTLKLDIAFDVQSSEVQGPGPKTPSRGSVEIFATRISPGCTEQRNTQDREHADGSNHHAAESRPL